MENSITEKNIDAWVDYLANQSQALSNLTDYQLNSIIDNEVLNPNVQAILSDDNLSKIADENEESYEMNLMTKTAVNAKSLRFWPKLKKLKRRVRKAFCKVMATIGDDEFDLKKVIRDVLLLLIPIFTGGIPALLLPIIIAIIVSLLRKGVSKVCPV